MTTLPPPELTQAAAVTERLQQAGYEISAATPSYVRHKPDETTIIAYRLTPAAGSDTWGYAQWCQDPARADQIHRKAATLRPRPSTAGPGLVRLDPHTVVYAFPNDARLRRLRWYTDPRKLKRSLEPLTPTNERISGSRTTVEVLRYKPERRVVVWVNLSTTHRIKPLLVRYSTRRQAAHLNRVAAHLRAHGIGTPAPVAHLDDDRVTVDEYIGGTQARDAIRAGALEAGALGHAISRLHGTTPPQNAPQRGAEAELARALDGLSGLSDWHPDLTRTALETGDLLRRHVPTVADRPVLLHGDLHTKNILVSDDRIAFIDLERIAIGPAEIDLGFLAAHAVAIGIRQPGWSPHAAAHAQAVVDEYRRDTGALDPAALAWHTAVGLAEQAVLVARHLETRWRQTSPKLLDLARQHLAEQHLAHTTTGARTR